MLKTGSEIINTVKNTKHVLNSFNNLQMFTVENQMKVLGYYDYECLKQTWPWLLSDVFNETRW